MRVLLAGLLALGLLAAAAPAAEATFDCGPMSDPQVAVVCITACTNVVLTAVSHNEPLDVPPCTFHP
jgi:hypothetical protein